MTSPNIVNEVKNESKMADSSIIHVTIFPKVNRYKNFVINFYILFSESLSNETIKILVAISLYLDKTRYKSQVTR